MATKHMHVSEMPGSLAEIIADVSVFGSHYIVTQDGMPMAAIVPMPVYKWWQRTYETTGELSGSPTEQDQPVRAES